MRVGIICEGSTDFVVLEALALEALALSVYDVFVIQVDASIRKLKELGLPEAESLEPLREHVRGWAGGNLPKGSAIVLPREELEAWLLAAHTNLKNVEAIEDPAGELAARQLIGMKKGKPDKDSSVYRKLVNPALVKLALDKKKLRQVPELERFVEQLRTHRRRAP